MVIEFLPAIEPGLGGREFFNELQLRMETAGNKLIDEAVARDPSRAYCRGESKTALESESGVKSVNRRRPPRP